MKKRICSAVLLVLFLSSCAAGDTAAAFKTPDKAFLESIPMETTSDEDIGRLVFTIDGSGSYSVSDIDTYSAAYMNELYDYMLTEEYYEKRKANYGDEAENYEEFLVTMEEYVEEERSELADYDAANGSVFFLITVTDLNEEPVTSLKDMCLRTTERVFEWIAADPEAVGSITGHATNNEFYSLKASGKYTEENILEITANLGFADSNGISEFHFEESISDPF